MVDWLVDNIINKLWDSLTSFTFGFIPTWVWVVIAVLAAAWVWRQFGWQGLVGLGLLILTFGAYRQGWRDAKAKRKPVVPIDIPVVPTAPIPAVKKKKPRRKTIFESLGKD